MTIVGLSSDLAEARAYVRNALEELVKHRSYIYEVLTGPLDEHIKDNLLMGAGEIERNLRKALL